MSLITYFEFHLTFLVPALLVLSAVAVTGSRTSSSDVRRSGVAIVTAVALAYTVPWDNYLIQRGVWWYGEGAVVGTLWHAPVEEYLFMLVQPLVAALWLDRVTRADDSDGADRSSLSPRARALGAAAGVAVGAVGVALLTGRQTLYLGAILGWAGPVLALQWGFGWTQLWVRRRTLVVAVAVPTAYLWAIDWLALRNGIWTLAPAYTTGWTLFGLPVEEATFFLVTNLFVVQGLLLYDWVLDRWE
jgi:lycopene cyclase domain-containing protein